MASRSPTPDNLILGRGIVRFAPIIDGVRAHYLDMGNVQQLSIATTDTKITQKSSRVPTNTIYKEVTSEREVVVTLQGGEFDADIVAAALQGEVVSVAAVMAGTVVAEAHVAPVELDVLIKLGKDRVSAVVVKQGMVTHTIGDDYEVVDASRGWIKLLASGDIDASMAFTVDYSNAAVAACKKIRGATETVVEASIHFTANNAAGPNRDATFYRASLSSDGELGFITNEYGQWTLKCKLLDDSDGNFGGSAASPLYELIDAPVAP